MQAGLLAAREELERAGAGGREFVAGEGGHGVVAGVSVYSDMTIFAGARACRSGRVWV
ncbi:hypothetical protein [Actinomadura livida]|uniref:Uncharacterized protein n=1 Tax=Actinomadura livida TaxID=79909 RepID=A0A7W7IFG3_9ACTN|nr:MULTISPECIES: hypothetical protein [Actinomadura]MBB4775728.1 hypothetical protein [Actinomadura catellatispora]GGU34705.1 hypothetical protein GCM10010208_69160 [Actinomadura livida]